MTASTEELVLMVESLPVDVKKILLERILNSLEPAQTKVDEQWSAEVERRIADLESGKVTAIPGSEVFDGIRDRLSG